MKKTILFLSILSVLLTACESKLVEQIHLIPQVQSADIHSGSFPISSLQTVQCPDEWKDITHQFIEDLSSTSHACPHIVSQNPSLELMKNDTLAEEEYGLKITPHKIELTASHTLGMIHALTTLHQLVLTSDGKALPALEIHDQPRYSYRGLLIDCSRHFWTIDELKKTIRSMSFFKLNKLHLHLTDNQAWRIEIKKYPELVKAGTYYEEYPELSGKYYRQEELKDLVHYAALRGVEIIPEIVLPAHCSPLLAAYPEFSCRGGHFQIYPEESDWNHRKRTMEDMVCIGNPKVYEFVQEVIDELAEIFPSRYVHLGGNGVRTGVWLTCPKCKAIYQKEKMKDPLELQDYFTRKVSDMLHQKGKVMMGWDDINTRGAATSKDVLTIWHDDGVAAQEKALAEGVPMVMCPQHGCYFDWGYSGNSTRKAYEWAPVPLGVTSEQRKLILGGQAALWTERVKTQDRVEWMLYPRLCALSEVFWTPAKQREWESFHQRLLQFFPVMETLDIHFYAEEALEEDNFVPSSRKPDLVRNAYIDTNIPVNNPYHPGYAFDNKINSFFWGGTSVGEEHYFQLNLEEPMVVNEVRVLTGDTKDYITHADLLVSADGKEFKKVGSFNEEGKAFARLSGETVKSVKIQITEQHTCWPIIREIILR